ncbi:MAG: ABC transporter ATP-binding protein [Burkholderiaceae bacterium]
MNADPDRAVLLEIEDIRIGYGKVQAVHGVSMIVREGSIVTVVGPNGAGKTTLMAAIMGLLPCTGRITFAGRDLADIAVEQRVSAGLALVPEQRELFAEMSVADNLALGALVRHRRGEKGIDASLESVYETFPRLRERHGQLAGTLSGGERQMLALGRALMAAPRLLMLDEPSLGLAPRIVREIFQVIARLRARGVSVLLVEQNARAALQVSDTAHVLENGVVVLAGASRELLDDPRVIASYPGMRAGDGGRSDETGDVLAGRAGGRLWAPRSAVASGTASVSLLVSIIAMPPS